MKDTRERYVTPSLPFSESQIATALAMRAEGATLEAICKRLQCGHSRLTRQIPALSGQIEKRKGLPAIKSHPLTDDEKAEIRRLKDDGERAQFWNAGIVGMSVAQVLEERLGEEIGVNFADEYPALTDAMQRVAVTAKKRPSVLGGKVKEGLATIGNHYQKKTGFSSKPLLIALGRFANRIRSA